MSELTIGHTLPRGSQVLSVTLDGERRSAQRRVTNRGLEVTVQTGPGKHKVVVTAG